MVKVKLGIRTRILLLLMAATILPLVVLNFFWASAQQQSLLKNARSEQALLTDNAANQVDNFVTRKLRALIIHAQSPDLLQFDIDHAPLELGTLLYQDKDLKRVALVDQRGKEVVALNSNLQASPLQNVSQTDAFRVVSYLSGKEYISSVTTDSGGHPTVTIAVPMVKFTKPQDLGDLSTAESGIVRTPQDIKGALIVQVSLDSLWSSVLSNASHTGTSQAGYAYVVDAQGRVIAHPDNSLVNQHRDLSDIASVALFKANLNTATPANRTLTAPSEKGVSVLGTYQKIPSTNWGVIFEEPMSGIYKTVNDSTLLSVVLAAIFIVLMALLSLPLTQYITKPILLIARAAERIGQGDFAARIVMKRRDEIGALSSSINTMGQNLQEFIARIEMQSHRIEAVFDNTAESILAIDIKGVITLANKASSKLTELPVDRIVGRNINDVFSWSKEAGPFKVDYLKPGTTVYAELMYTNPHGILHDVKLIVVHPTNGQEVTQAIITIHDETESRELEKMKIDFVSLAAHELRTPLAAIRGYLDLLNYQMADQLNETMKHYISQARTSVIELGDLIGNLLNVTRIERGTLAMSMSKIDLAECAVEAVQNLQFNAAAKNITLSYQGQQKGCAIIGDGVAMREVLRNLVDNAVKYTLPKGKIDVIMRETGKHYEIDVKDTGVGIPPQALPRLFTKFYRVHGGLESGSRGTGLGLFIAKSIVELHNGTIGVMSKEDVGSVFTVKLPKFNESELEKLQQSADKTSVRRKRGWVTKNIAR